jgi:hypothetical protein
MQVVIKSSPRSQAAQRVRVAPVSVVLQAHALRVLDFDVEARPLHWISGDYVSKEVTAIAWAWTDQPKAVKCYLLGECDPVEMLEAFRADFDQADMVTGHYIRGYDLPMVNGALTEYQRPVLGDVLAQDTKLDLVRRQGLSSSQENIGAMLQLVNPKVKMDQKKWRDANRLTKAGRAATRERVMGDVRQHIEMRKKLLELGYLGAPKLWKSGTPQLVEPYTP